jgi:hypothetical protein
MRAGPRGLTSFELQCPSFLHGEILQAYYDGETDDPKSGGWPVKWPSSEVIFAFCGWDQAGIGIGGGPS